MEIYIQQVVLSVPDLSCGLAVVPNNVFNFYSRYSQLYDRGYFYFLYLEGKKGSLKEGGVGNYVSLC